MPSMHTYGTYAFMHPSIHPLIYAYLGYSQIECICGRFSCSFFVTDAYTEGAT